MLAGHLILAFVCAGTGLRASAEPVAPDPSFVLFPSDELFDPLVADVRWPRMSVEHQWRLGTDEFGRVAGVGFGESFSFVRSPRYAWGRWEFGLQAMVDAIFDMTAKSFDLANEDYFVGFAGSIESHGITTQLRIYHVSSHLGDEYLLENGGDREDVSFESIDVLVSADPLAWMRVYGGLGVLIKPRPNFDPVTLQLGTELTSPVSFARDLLTPFFGADLQFKQEAGWEPEVAVLVGLRLARPEDAPARDVRRLEFYARYYHGRSPDNQFFRQSISSVALGMRLGF